MRKFLLLLCVFMLPWLALAEKSEDKKEPEKAEATEEEKPKLTPNLANGKEINKNCAVCHGVYSQGTPGRLSPRLASLPQDYLEKAIKEYRDGKRHNLLMMKTAGIDTMTEQDIVDISAYLAQIDLTTSPSFNIKKENGDVKTGKKLFKGDCKSCHGRDGFGKPKKGAPPLAGQHHEYIFQSIKMFQSKVRHHDNDPEDETFDDFSDAELSDLTAYIASLDDTRIKPDGQPIVPKILAAMPTMPAMPAIPAMPTMPAMPAMPSLPKAKPKSGLQITDITQTVAQIGLEKGVTVEDAIEAMRSKAAELNLKMVGEQFVSKELEARGEKTPYLSIHQFCDPMDARTMIMQNPIFASYMPCRISLVEDPQGKMWLMMLNLDMLINSELLSQEVVETAIRVNQSMLDIMVSGASGEF